jgi:DNA-binding winged helix-turn-helix (wHTH) protein/thioredoxin-like negative regulator of GroEL
MEQNSENSFRFGPFILEPHERRLLRDGASVPLRAKTFDLLVLLVRNRDRLLGKDEILDGLWSNVAVTESSLTSTMSELRQALGDSERERYIETITKKGYRFIAPVELLATQKADSARAPAAITPPTRRNWVRYAAALALIAVILAVTLWRLGNRTASPAQTTYLHAVELEREGNDRLALEALNEVLRLQPSNDDASVRAAWIAYQDNENDVALKYLERAGLLSPAATVGAGGQTAHGRSIRLRAESLSLLLNGASQEALRKLQIASGIDPTDQDVLYQLSDLQIALGLYDDADAVLARCKRLQRADPFCAFNEIALRVYQDRFEDALAAYSAARQDGIRYLWLDEPVGFATLAKGDSKAALDHFHALEESGRRVGSNVHFRASQDGIAAVALYEGRLEDARRQITSALETSDSPYDKASYVLYLAQIDNLHGDRQSAQQQIHSALQLSDAPDLAMIAARQLGIAGDYDGALELLRRNSASAPRLGKSYPAAEQFINGLKWADKDINRSIALLADAYRLDSAPDLGYYLAQAQIRAMRWDQATATLNKILSARGAVLMDNVASLIPLAHRDLSICYEHLGNRSEAERHITQLQALWRNADSQLKTAIFH